MTPFLPGSLIERIKADSLRVHAPTVVVFLCGGAMKPLDERPTALRDAFYREIARTQPAFSLILAESAKPLEADAGYTDLFQFESDIAQIVGLILLFAESPGSIAELGAFAALKSVSPRLLAILDDFYYNEVSFIRNGPVRYLENEHGEEWISVLERKHIGISQDGSIENLNSRRLLSSLMPSITKRLEMNAKWTKFDQNNSGHVILLIVGLCQEFGALTITEIRKSLEFLKITDARLKHFLYCGELLSWITKIRKSNHIYYATTGGEHALDYSLDADPGRHDKVRWRASIREYWAKHEPSRHRAIAEAIAKVTES